MNEATESAKLSADLRAEPAETRTAWHEGEVRSGLATPHKLMEKYPDRLSLLNELTVFATGCKKYS